VWITLVSDAGEQGFSSSHSGALVVSDTGEVVSDVVGEVVGGSVVLVVGLVMEVVGMVVVFGEGMSVFFMMQRPQHVTSSITVSL